MKANEIPNVIYKTGIRADNMVFVQLNISAGSKLNVNSVGVVANAGTIEAAVNAKVLNATFLALIFSLIFLNINPPI